MGRTGEIVEYGAMGVGVTIFLWLLVAFSPTIMVSLSIVDTFYNVSSGKISDEDLSSAYTVFWVLFAIIGGIQGGLVANIRVTWGIVVPWFLLSIHPLFYYLVWLTEMDVVPFPGIDWMPW